MLKKDGGIMAFEPEFNKFTGKLKEILEHELRLGNTIRAAYTGDWPALGYTVIALENPFTPPIYKNERGIVFRNINDPHYWKAEYQDAANKLLLLGHFGGAYRFDEL